MTCPPRLLVVDDDPSVAAAYKLVLEEPTRSQDGENHSSLDDLEAELFGSSEKKESPHGWRVSFLDQGLDAVAEVRRSLESNDPVAAVFLDVRMPPGIDGYETAKRIRQLDKNVHIVIVTAFSDYSYEDFLLVAGPADRLNYLPKPIWPHELRQVARLLTSENEKPSFAEEHSIPTRDTSACCK